MWIRRTFRRRRTCVLFLIFTLILFVIGFYLNRDDVEKNGTFNQLQQKEYVDKKGMHVIVAYYSATRAWDSQANFSQDIANKLNEYSPIKGEGENGEPVYLPFTLIKRSQALYHINKFNIMASDRISVNRSLPDLRKAECKNRKFYLKSLPKTSIIIVFHNEAWSTLLRTVHSVINKSPISLLHEIILVDDASTRVFLGTDLESYVAHLPVTVTIMRLKTRVGLIKARLEGATLANSEVLTFLDAHCECTKGWLEPLLQRISQNRSHVVCPIIDIINDENFAYLRSFDLHWGAFNWNLHFRWLSVGNDIATLRKQNASLPYKTPVMAGGLFAIDKSYFDFIGQYDSNMSIWGGENIEMSFRIWMCGGSIEIVPCSRVGHVFRKSSPYDFPGGVANILHKNLARVAEVWMDEWKHFFYKLNPEARRLAILEDVEERKKIRAKLKCNSFSWYLENVWPQNFFPSVSTFFGKIRNLKNEQCLQRPMTNGDGANVGNSMTKICAFEIFAPQLFVVSKDGFIMSDESVCLSISESSNPTVSFTACNLSKYQKWKYISKEQIIVHEKTSLCLDLPTKKNPTTLSIQKCSESTSQKWQFQVISWK